MKMKKTLVQQWSLTKLHVGLWMWKYFTKFAAFYLNSGPRKTRLRAFCLADNGITCGNDYAPQKTFGIRWVDSHHTANLRIFKNHKLYVSHLKVLEFDPIYKNAPGTRLTIRQFRQFLTHQNVIITLCVQLDIARVYKGISKVFQVNFKIQTSPR